MEGFFQGRNMVAPVSDHNFCSLVNKYKCYIVIKNHDNGEAIANDWVCFFSVNTIHTPKKEARTVALSYDRNASGGYI